MVSVSSGSQHIQRALGLLLKRSPATIRKYMRQNQFAVPGGLHIPGTRLLRWREKFGLKQVIAQVRFHPSVQVIAQS